MISWDTTYLVVAVQVTFNVDKGLVLGRRMEFKLRKPHHMLCIWCPVSLIAKLVNINLSSLWFMILVLRTSKIF